MSSRRRSTVMMVRRADTDRCQQALSMAIKQAEEDGVWFASTLQLQMVSLSMCVDCRDVLAYHVTITDETQPGSFGLPRGPMRRSSGRPTSGRIPPLKAIHLIWERQNESPFQIDMSTALQIQSLDVRTECTMVGAVWQEHVKALVMGSNNEPLTSVT
ncbi:unnamed protein product [Pylaiella littoralis]